MQRSSNYQGTKAPAEGLQERPGGGGTTRPWRARRDTRKDLGAEKHHGLEGPAEGPTEELPEGPAGNGRKIQRRGCRKVPRWICRKGQQRICRKAQRGSCRKGQQRSGRKVQQRHRSQVRRMEATWQGESGREDSQAGFLHLRALGQPHPKASQPVQRLLGRQHRFWPVIKDPPTSSGCPRPGRAPRLRAPPRARKRPREPGHAGVA